MRITHPFISFYARHLGWKKNLHSLFFIIGFIVSSFSAYSQCATCDFTATSGQTYNFNGNQTLCITSNVNNIGWNMNGSDNKICVATGVVWDAGFMGNLASGTVIDVYGTVNITQAPNVNGGTATLNIHTGATVNIASGVNQGMNINNDGTLNFTADGTSISTAGTAIITNSAGATITALKTTNFIINNNVTLNNYGTVHLANAENSEGYINNYSTGSFVVDRSFNNHGAFINIGDYQLPCTTLAGAAGATTCSFRVGDKGVGKEFINNSCFCVKGNVTFDGPGTNNGTMYITGDLTLNKILTGLNGRVVLENGVSTISISGGYTGTGLQFCDKNTSGNGFDSVAAGRPADYTVNCTPTTCTCDPTAVACTTPNCTTTVTVQKN